ncbi:hypothetical protein [Gloeobacter violaceus]|uniref:Gll1319 protein n=1 Tax=Gloeobacter violaceus (strain ATCC 29082 / PCC 7421) TaxID=251221 RepID=Q7NL07_GLOVI|nr:hypothetical protein [Gloeobacter violaceus]BAC89260.1 gll1319 [Gloeobacter violaceus PCC 7421]
MQNAIKFATLLAFATTIAGSTQLPPQASAQTAPEDVLVSDPSEGIADPEFDQYFGRFTWVDGQGNVWLGNVDPQTGDFLPPNGKAILVDTGAVSVLEVGNGPEWVYTSSGPQIVYTKYDNNGRFAIARGRQTGDTWGGALLQKASARYGPYGSLDRFDPKPRISYVGRDAAGKQVVEWRYLDQPDSEAEIPGSIPPGGRWVEGLPAIVLPQRAKSTNRQAFFYNIETGELEQLTFDAGDKAHVFMWKAPEYNNEYIFLALIDETSIGVYRKVDGAWTRINTVKPPSVGNYLWSPEPFVHNGKSYLIMTTSTSDDQKSTTVPTDVWMAGIDPEAPFYKQVSDPSVKVRKDPEVFFTANGPYIYYSALRPNVIYRSDPGLGPAQ